jgi:hypothetical protein
MCRPDLDALAERCYAGWFDASFDTKPDVEHVLRSGQQINVNFESAIFDRSLHEDLRFPHRRKAGKSIDGLFTIFHGRRLQTRRPRLLRQLLPRNPPQKKPIS